MVFLKEITTETRSPEKIVWAHLREERNVTEAKASHRRGIQEVDLMKITVMKDAGKIIEIKTRVSAAVAPQVRMKLLD